MTSILFLTQAIYCNIFRCNYLRNKRYFLNFLLDFPNLDPILNIFKKEPNYCWNPNDRTFTIFIDRCERKSSWKSFPEEYAKSSDCLLTHWLPMTSILFLTEAICCNISTCNYLRNKKYFLDFCLHIRNLDSILYIFKKKMTLIADVFLNLRTPKNVVR